MRVVPEETVLAGRYRLGKRLGHGGMADVFDGFDERLHRPVAIKLLKPLMAVRPDLRSRFEDEARAAARLSHPNVVGVHDTGEDDGTPFIVMERLPGETMGDRMAAGPLDTEWVRRIGGDVLLALGAAHDAGIIHRDVKPGNILIAPDGCAKVADFGIAKTLEVAGDLTATNQLIGTPAYLAPERIEGKPATPGSDLYALGVVLYEALAGVKPFAGDTPLTVAYAVQHNDPAPLAGLRPDVPADFVAAIGRAMARNPADRFGSAAEMAGALHVPGPAAAPIDETIVAAPVDPTLVVDSTPVAIASAAPALGGPKAADRPAGGWVVHLADRIHLERRQLIWIAGLAALALLFLLLIAGPDGTTPGADSIAKVASTTVPVNPLSTSLRGVAKSLSAADGAHATEAAGRLNAVADAVQNGGGAPEANALLASLPGWRADGGLSGPAAARISAVTLRVPGADAAVLVPTTATPAPKGNGKKKGKDEGD